MSNLIRSVKVFLFYHFWIRLKFSCFVSQLEILANCSLCNVQRDSCPAPGSMGQFCRSGLECDFKFGGTKRPRLRRKHYNNNSPGRDPRRYHEEWPNQHYYYFRRLGRNLRMTYAIPPGAPTIPIKSMTDHLHTSDK